MSLLLMPEMKLANICTCILILVLGLNNCTAGSQQAVAPRGTREGNTVSSKPPSVSPEAGRNPGKIIHVVVALCDNQYQGIVPVPERIGNGDDPANNLYWGAGYGVKNFFRKAKDWSLISEVQHPRAAVLERVVFKRKDESAYLVAEAYRGREIKQSIIDFLRFASGSDVETLEIKEGEKQYQLYVGGAADLIAYVGHDGLMDFNLPQYPQKADDRRRAAVILACISKSYFKNPLRQTGAEPLLWTTGLMAPEAYVLKAATDGWLLNEGGERIRRRAAEAYNKYQKCGIKGAMNLFSSGWGE